MSAISYVLTINETPVSPDVLDAVQQIEVEDHADMADMLRLRIAIAVRDGSGKWNVLDDEVFSRLDNIKIIMTIGTGLPEVLISAYVIETSVSFSNQPGQSVLDVVAMDPTVLMNLEDKVRPWPNMSDSDIATVLFGEYGFMPVVEQTQPFRDEVDVTTMQRDTDIKFLTGLAARNGFEVYVEVNPLTGMTEGHFHPPGTDQTPQEVLSVNMGEYTNVNSLNSRYDMLRPTKAKTKGIDLESQSDQEVRIESQSQASMGKRSLLGGDRMRSVLLSRSGLSQTGELQNYAQAITDRSSWAITADGELNTVAYGGILRAKRPVEVRGAGQHFSGTYYVERVHHVIGDSYTQSFTLRRNALELTGLEQFTTDNALTT